jgi:hypothetical protein
MLSRRKILIVALFVFMGLLFLTAVGLVYRGFVAKHLVGTELDTKWAELDRLYHRNPFSSEQNLKVEQDNLQVLNEEMQSLLAAMGKGQIESVNQSPPKFMAQFWEARSTLKAQAREMGVELAGGDEFDFGFGRHMQGNLPAPQDVPRLTQQLKIVQALCGVLYTARIVELKGIGREEFEVDAVSGAAVKPTAPAGRRPQAGHVSLNVLGPNAGLIPDGQLFGKWHFTWVFTARESALVSLLNGLARSPVFAVVTRLDVVADDKLFQKAAEPGRVATKTDKRGLEAVVAKEGTPGLTRDQRVVCGRSVTPLTVRMELDVYQFVKVQTAGDTAKAEGQK